MGTQPYTVKNKMKYSDKRRSNEDIAKVIEKLHDTGCIYSILKNNCEHIATYIVYGVCECEQVKNNIH